MRAALSILGLVIVLAIVMLMMKQQAKSLAPRPVAQPAAASEPAATNLPQQLRQQVDAALQQGAARASEAQP
ncbi:hypothetical protein [Roseateles violae]|uniref:Uncharacterized protein n=1 Tax=Roseateles violae TaxID=3058042 RepID=A0ABT8DVP7_9BURK|nr:hypothetical protein [Pelomonas sp. PFR6]MDN3922068.1 hypothetical protein [Pelomonas sp. PFR6]